MQNAGNIKYKEVYRKDISEEVNKGKYKDQIRPKRSK